jgi:hypothetical protein
MIFGGEIMIQLRVWNGMRQILVLIILPLSPIPLFLAPLWKVFLHNAVFFPKITSQSPSSPQDF